MRVVRTEFPVPEMAALVMALCNEQSDSLEVALFNHVKEMGADPQDLIAKHTRVYEIPFSSEKKYMLTSNMVEGAEIAFLKGAPDIVIDFCKMDPTNRLDIEGLIESWAGEGLKTLALAFKEGENLSELVDFRWAGLVGIEDPVRPTVRDAIHTCKTAGISTKMITGDYRGTAEKVATVLGIPASPDRVLERKGDRCHVWIRTGRSGAKLHDLLPCISPSQAENR